MLRKNDEVVDKNMPQDVLGDIIISVKKVEEFNVGVNFAVLDSRLNVDVDYYNRMTKNAVISTTLPFSTQTLA